LKQFSSVIGFIDSSQKEDAKYMLKRLKTIAILGQINKQPFQRYQFINGVTFYKFLDN
jgi:hypothetical protein